MTWPQPQEFNEAIQNPNTAFFNADLKRGIVKLTALGLPKPISGGFANVYEVKTPQGTWAVRCFIREIADSQHRYEKISQALNNLNLPYVAPFEFQRQGIRVGSRSFPIVKMQWIPGDPLNEYVSKNVGNSVLITNLAAKWVNLMASLRTNQLAHCDLQHGNILILNHELKLIDYDGMFVTAFRGMKANEQGHPNFQHPQRNEHDFGLQTDHFSSWVIYAALRILSVLPEMLGFAKSLGREECLLFNREDFTQPHRSPLFYSLCSHRNKTAAQMGNFLMDLLNRHPSAIPALDPALVGDSSKVTKPISTETSRPEASGREWWREHITNSTTSIRQTATHSGKTYSSPGMQLRECKWSLYYLRETYGIELYCVPPGIFEMGDSIYGPVHEVTISQRFWLGKTQVTQAQWRVIMGTDPSHFKGDNLPVENISHNDCIAFCQKLTKWEQFAGRLDVGYAYTLPTEAQWEYACNAGSSGDNAGDIDDIAWHSNNSNGTTRTVGTKKANDWGFHDMLGNVGEWCADWYGPYISSHVIDPNGAVSGSCRVLKGGSWIRASSIFRSALRGKVEPSYRSNELGFRLALRAIP